jgi:general secretion pathway protein E
MHMNVDPLSMVSALNGVLAQRLVRVICQECVQDISPTEQMLKLAGIDRSGAASIRWRKGRGCGACRGTGYRGRKAVGELLILNDELREAITSRVPVRRLKELAAQTEMRFLRDSAMNLLRLGETTVEEVNRVTGFA